MTRRITLPLAALAVALLSLVGAASSTTVVDTCELFWGGTIFEPDALAHCAGSCTAPTSCATVYESQTVGGVKYETWQCECGVGNDPETPCYGIATRETSGSTVTEYADCYETTCVGTCYDTEQNDGDAVCNCVL